MRTHVEITVKLLNPNGKHRAYEHQSFDIPVLEGNELSSAADKAVRAACEALGSKLPPETLR